MIASTFKRLIKSAFYWLVICAGPVGLRNAWLRLHRETRCTVLLYHRVNDASRDNVTTSSARFAEHMATLKRHYPVISLSEAMDGLGTGRYLGPNVVVITFDDGYADNHDVAAPILERFGLPASFFVTVGFMGTSSRFEHDARSPHAFANLSWDQVRSLEARGFEIGSHGWSHRNLARCTPEEARAEILRARDGLTQQLGHAVRAFAYPFGSRTDITSEVLQQIREAGFEVILSAYGGVNHGRVDPDNVMRVGVADVSDVWALRAKVEGITPSDIRDRMGRRRTASGASGIAATKRPQVPA